MKSDLYSKVVLTVIAIVLCGILSVSIWRTQNVRLVEIVRPSDSVLNIADKAKLHLWDEVPITGEVDANVEEADEILQILNSWEKHHKSSNVQSNNWMPEALTDTDDPNEIDPLHDSPEVMRAKALATINDTLPYVERKKMRPGRRKTYQDYLDEAKRNQSRP
jgi:hypothetical protein